MDLLELLIFGSGGAPAISVSPTSWDFGSTPVGTAPTKEFTVTNLGTGTLEITLPITIDNAAFTVTVDPATSVAPGASTTFTLQADADDFGAASGNISIASNAASSPTLIAVSVYVDFAFLLHDQFLTNDAAPLDASSSAEPSPGLRKKSADTNNNGLVAANALVYSGAGATNYADPAYYWTTDAGAGFARQAGRVVFFTVVTLVSPAGIHVIGVSNNTTPAVGTQFGLLLTGGNLDIFAAGTFAVSEAHENIRAYEVAIAERATGHYVFIRGGAFSDWTLLFPWNRGSDATLYPAVAGGTSSASHLITNVRLGDSATFADEANIVSLNVASPVSGTIQSAIADGWFFLSFATGGGVAGKYVELRYRVLDADNYRFARIEWSGTNWDFEHGYVVATVETVEASAASIGGGQIGLFVRAIGSTISIWTDSGVVTRRVAGITSATHSTETGVAAVGNGAVTLTQMQAYLRSGNSSYNALGTGYTIPAFVTIGDSKTLSSDVPRFLFAQMASNSKLLPEQVGSVAAGGRTVATTQDNIDAGLAAISDTANYVLINLGSNDAGSLPAENTFKTDYRYIIDAIHTKWPSAVIYLAKPVLLAGVPASTPVAAVATLHGWIDDLVAEYAYVYEGIDETDLEGGDGYVTYFTDTTHYTNAGTRRAGELWAAILGY